MSLQRKVLIIGIDGADPDLIEDFVKKGNLANIKQVIKNGAYGRLTSTIPMVSNVSWTSFITGKNPGKHNIFAFARFNEKSNQIETATSLDRKSETIWHILNRHNKKVGILNLPCLYPPEKIEGFMVCGLLTPKINCNFIYPESLQREFLSEIKGYGIDIGTKRAAKDKEILLKEIYEISKKRKEATQYLINKFDCDLFITIFTGTDRIQHFFWRDMEDKKLPYKDAILNYFEFIDSIIGNFTRDLEEDTTLFILSDHGMGGLNKIFCVNNWFKHKKLLYVKRNSIDYFKHRLVHWVVKKGIILLTKLKLNPDSIRELFPSTTVDHLINIYCYGGNVNWTRTKAYFLPGQGDGIIINLKGRQPQGIVDQEDYEPLRDYIIKGLCEVKDPDTQDAVIKKVYKREELFSGSYLKDAPDLIIQLSDGYRGSEEINEKYDILGEVGHDELVTADHCQEGIMMAYGKNIKSCRTLNSELIDIAPTILHLMDVSIPRDMDGKVLKDIFKEDSEPAQREVRLEDYKSGYGLREAEDKKRALRREEEEKIKERLKALGYL